MKFIISFSIVLFSLSSLAFYPNSYKESRDHFLQLKDKLKKSYPRLKHSALKIPTQTDAELYTDTIYISQNGNKNDGILVMTSGTHGVEAFTGSAIQSQFIEEQLNNELLEKMGILIVHAVNPYGFHFKRRVTENNIDLNRNFSANESHFHGTNPAYTNLEKFLNPLDTLNSSLFSDIILFAKSLVLLAQYGKKSLTQAVVGGQYQFEKGIYFGGSKHEPQVEILKKEFIKYASPYKNIFHIDLHTGYGERGKLHYFINQSTINKSEKLKKLFEGYDLDTDSKVDFYETSGDFAHFMLNLFPDKNVIPMVFEFGTMDSQTILGSFQSLKNMIYENQGFQYGYTSDDSKKRTESEFLNMFSPDSTEWREKILNKSSKELKVLLIRFHQLSVSTE